MGLKFEVSYFYRLLEDFQIQDVEPKHGKKLICHIAALIDALEGNIILYS